jgi:hypothetical protein
MKVPFPLVLIEWQDATGGYRDWTQLEFLMRELPICVSVGYLIYKGKDRLTLLPHYIKDMPEEGSVPFGFGEITVPIKTIVKMTVLRKRPK